MIESSHKQEGWLTLGPITKSSAGAFIIKDLIVRWNEQARTISGPDEDRIEYVYDALRFDLELPPEVQPGIEAVEYYLEQAKSAILSQAQNIVAQEGGFLAD